jgi:hypothetical protein
MQISPPFFHSYNKTKYLCTLFLSNKKLIYLSRNKNKNERNKKISK